MVATSPPAGSKSQKASKEWPSDQSAVKSPRSEKSVRTCKMVTTIKITCDGVFIQSNPFFSNSHLRSSSSSQSSSSLSLSSPSMAMLTDDGSPRTGQIALDAEATDDTVPVKNGNLTVVIRNNRRKIVRPETESLYNAVEPRHRDGQGKTNELQGNDTATVEETTEPLSSSAVRICRPAYHYMYMVRKVQPSRGPLSANRDREGGGGGTGNDAMLMDGNRSQAVAAEVAAVATDNGVRVTMMSTLSRVERVGGVASSSSWARNGEAKEAEDVPATMEQQRQRLEVDVGQ